MLVRVLLLPRMKLLCLDFVTKILPSFTEVLALLSRKEKLQD